MTTIMQVNAQNAITEKRKLNETMRSNRMNEILKHESNTASIESAKISAKGRIDSAKISANANIYGSNLNAYTTMQKTKYEQAGLWQRQLEDQSFKEKQNALDRQVDWFKAISTDTNTKYANETGRINAISTRRATTSQNRLNKAKGIAELTPNNALGYAARALALAEIYGDQFVSEDSGLGKAADKAGNVFDNAMNYVFDKDTEGHSLLGDAGDVWKGWLKLQENAIQTYKNIWDEGVKRNLKAIDNVWQNSSTNRLMNSLLGGK